MRTAVRPERSGERVFAAQAAQRLTRPVQPRLALGLATRLFSLTLDLAGVFLGLRPVQGKTPTHGEAPGEAEQEAQSQ